MMQKDLSRTYERQLGFMAPPAKSYSSLGFLVIGIVLATLAPEGLTKDLNHTATIRIQRVPNTWELAATDDSVFFDLGSSILDSAALEVIERHAKKLKANPVLRVTLIAHTDDLGSSSLELAKGQERLDVLRKRLEDLKVSPGQIRTENHGSEFGSVPLCSDDDCRRNSRRVDFLFGP